MLSFIPLVAPFFHLSVHSPQTRFILSSPLLMTSTMNSSAGHPATAGITPSPHKLFPPTFHVDGKTATLEIDTRMDDPRTLCEYLYLIQRRTSWSKCWPHM